MATTISLNGKWGLTYAEGSPLTIPGHYTGPLVPGRKLIEADVPAPVHQVLLERGLIDDPNVAMNSLKARWVEECFWIYRRSFTLPSGTSEDGAWLTFERLECIAVVFLNGEEIGRHENALIPARFNVTGKLKDGENEVIVQLETGTFACADKPVGNYSSGDVSAMTRRPWLRKPQYQGSWDWTARLQNVGILGDVTLELSTGPKLGQVSVFATPSDDLARATLTIRAAIDSVSESPVQATLRAKIVETGQQTELPISVPTGESRHEAVIDIESPKLWWPIGHGEQFRYTVEVTLESGGEKQTVTRKTGVRKVEIDRSPHPVEGEHFIITVNGRHIFCKGGDWVPADMLYSTVTPDRYRKLVNLAIGANFNMLRVWGGGVYTEHALCDICDELGVMLWHDFIFACAKYPAQDPEFLDEVIREVTFITRELAHHPSLLVWCGNNETEWGYFNWGYTKTDPAWADHAIFHHYMPMIVGQEDPSTRYWPSSPYSPGFKLPNDPTLGDQHPWGVSLGTPGPAEWWDYRGYVDRFPNEGGVMGCSSLATLKQFLPEDEQHLFSHTWDHHDNPFAMMDTDRAKLGHAYQTVEFWAGRDPLEMDWEEYAILSGMLQAEGLSEYASNYRRRMFSSSSAIFWMYNDSWPVTHGWTIVDYYARQKLSYHPVRRAFQPVTVVITEEDGLVTVFGVNDTPQDWSGELRYGFFKLAGGLPVDDRSAVWLPANASTPIAKLPLDQWQKLGLKETGAFAVLSKDGKSVAQYRLFLERFKDLALSQPEIELQVTGDEVVLTSETFAWRVCLDVEGDADLADNCFDLLPGIAYRVPWSPSLGNPKISAVGNRFLA